MPLLPLALIGCVVLFCKVASGSVKKLKMGKCRVCKIDKNQSKEQ